MVLRNLLLQYERENNWTREEAIKHLGVGRSTYFRWLNGETTTLKKKTLKHISEVLQTDVEFLLEQEERLKPIVGSVKAGYDYLAEENCEGYVEVNGKDANKGDFFLRVVGDSMEGSHIFEGDLVFIQACDTVRDGQIALVMIGDEATIKRVRYKNNMMFLEATNPKYETRIFTMEEMESLPVKIVGKVKYVRTDFD